MPVSEKIKRLLKLWRVASRSANNSTNKATDRSEHAEPGIGTAVMRTVR
jgi:hypothetical protein